MAEKECGHMATIRYTWPGKDESYACIDHATQIQAVAQAMGLHLQMLPLTISLDSGIDDIPTCGNKVSD